ncbi:hypothetical protein LXL04_007219 [Taraxacum kok-saghyz]
MLQFRKIKKKSDIRAVLHHFAEPEGIRRGASAELFTPLRNCSSPNPKINLILLRKSDNKGYRYRSTTGHKNLPRCRNHLPKRSNRLRPCLGSVRRGSISLKVEVTKAARVIQGRFAEEKLRGFAEEESPIRSDFRRREVPIRSRGYIHELCESAELLLRNGPLTAKRLEFNYENAISRTNLRFQIQEGHELLIEKPDDGMESWIPIELLTSNPFASVLVSIPALKTKKIFQNLVYRVLYPKLMHFRMPSGSIPPPSSATSFQVAESALILNHITIIGLSARSTLVFVKLDFSNWYSLGYENLSTYGKRNNINWKFIRSQCRAIVERTTISSNPSPWTLEIKH